MSAHQPSSPTPDGTVARLGARGVLLSTHARDRCDERLPARCATPEVAWNCGEDVDDPQRLAVDTPLSRVRVFAPTAAYTVVFKARRTAVGEVVVTVERASQYDGAVRRWLDSFGPHGPAVGGGGGCE